PRNRRRGGAVRRAGGRGPEPRGGGSRQRDASLRGDVHDRQAGRAHLRARRALREHHLAGGRERRVGPAGRAALPSPGPGGRRRKARMRVFLIVLDGVGMGALPDAADYGDEGSNTLLHVAEAVGGLRVPALERLGLGSLIALPGVGVRREPLGARGRLTERSAGKDSTTGHWELAGLVLERPFPTYPHGFPPALLERIGSKTGREWLGNEVASGTEIIARLGQAQQESGKLIVYTSADS